MTKNKLKKKLMAYNCCYSCYLAYPNYLPHHNEPKKENNNNNSNKNEKSNSEDSSHKYLVEKKESNL
jgi:hypothetical protein